ncbi:MAG: hypothetical protein P8Y79_10875, partial [Ignavibacteriaceae bacterium]
DELKRSVIFAPENKIRDINKPKLKPENDSNIFRIKRADRTAERDLTNGSKIYHLGAVHDIRIAKKSEEHLFPEENIVKESPTKTQLNARIDQFKFREQRITEKNLFDEEIKKESRINLTREEETKYNEFRNTPDSEPIESYKIKVKEFGSEKIVETDSQNRNEDDLFTKFLKDLENESNMKVKKQNKLKRKGRESDIIQLFKSVKAEQTSQNITDEENIILRSDGNSEDE